MTQQPHAHSLSEEEAADRTSIQQRRRNSSSSEADMEREQLEAQRARREGCCGQFLYPQGVDLKYHKYVAFMGRVGFVAKGVVYALVGGLACATADQISGPMQGNESPQVTDHIRP